jgi:hypothetical protein
MQSEFPRIDPEKAVSPHAQEVEYALILSRMITTVREDASQLRRTVYEFARARLKIEMSSADEAERQRLAEALETAIHGVENFSRRHDEQERLQPPIAYAQIAPAASTPPSTPPSNSMVAIHQVTSPSAGFAKYAPAAEAAYWRTDASPLLLEARRRVLLSRLTRFCIGMLLFAAVVGLAIYKPNSPFSLSRTELPPAALTVAKPDLAQQAALDPKTVASVASLPFPLPSDYGVYAVSNAALSELSLLPEQVPDKRIAMSTPINQPSRTTLPDGKAKFVVFRRDLAGNAPERIDVRVVARVVRVLTFDAKGKASFSPVSDAWNIRNVSYEFRVRPIAGNPEMLLIQAADPNFVLSPGRYVLALKNQGYDFTVAGKVTDPAQCLERTDAANGTFYSDCQKP